MESPLKNFLDRYKHLIPTSRVVKEEVVKVLKNKCNITLEENQIEVRNSIVYLRVSPSARSVIYRKKNTLLECVNSHIKTTIEDIR